MVWRIGYVFEFLAVIVFCFCVAFISGCKTEEKFGKFTDEEVARFDSQKSVELPTLTGGSVLSIGEETLTADEVIRLLEGIERLKSPTASRDIREVAKSQSVRGFYNLFFTQTGQIVERRVADLLLYEKARVEAGDDIDDMVKKYIKAEKNRFRAKYGNDYAKADQALEGEGYSSWKDFDDKKKQEMLVRRYLSKRSEKVEAITYSDLKKYYENNSDLYHVDGMIECEYIDIVLSDLEGEHINMDIGESSSQAAVRIANELIVKVEAGADMGELAMEKFPEKYTNKTKVYDKARIADLGPPYDSFVRYAERMSPGDVTEPIKSKDHVLVMKLLEYTEERDLVFEDVRDEIQSSLERKRFIKQDSEIFLESMSETNLTDLDEFINMCVMQAYKSWGGRQ